MGRSELAGFPAAVAVEIRGGRFDQRHALAEHGLELVRTREFRAERHGHAVAVVVPGFPRHLPPLRTPEPGGIVCHGKALSSPSGNQG